MSHLGQDQLYTAVFDRTALAAGDKLHLAQCAACRRTCDELIALRRELLLARAAAATPAAIDRYTALFAEVQTRAAPLAALWRSVTALLTWDSRRQAALQGVRSSASGAAGAAGMTGGSYRLLYASESAEVELLVEDDGPLFRVQGELLAQEEADQGPALIQWFAQDGELAHEVQSGVGGQFALRGVQRGNYRLFILSPAGSSIEIEALEIA